LPIIVIITLADLLWFAHGRSVQSSPGLYYPLVPALQNAGAALQKEDGRIIGYRCLPANLAAMAGLRDVRGYDAVDPDHMVDLLALAAEPGGKPLSYAVTQWLAPAHSFRGDGTIQLSPILDLLGVNYVVFRGSPPPGTRTAFESPDYWVAENTNALPRAFIPSEVDLVADSEQRLERMASPNFNPRRVALVEDEVNVPASVDGTATVREESPTRIRIQSRSSGPALLVLADRWDAGWRAWVDGEERPVLRVNHALRGVVVSAGESVVEFRYAPRSFRLGLTLAGVAAGVLLCSAAVLFIQRKREAEAVSA
jgi:hypothetical protein